MKLITIITTIALVITSLPHDVLALRPTAARIALSPRDESEFFTNPSFGKDVTVPMAFVERVMATLTGKIAEAQLSEESAVFVRKTIRSLQNILDGGALQSNGLSMEKRIERAKVLAAVKRKQGSVFSTRRRSGLRKRTAIRDYPVLIRIFSPVLIIGGILTIVASVMIDFINRHLIPTPMTAASIKQFHLFRPTWEDRLEAAGIVQKHAALLREAKSLSAEEIVDLQNYLFYDAPIMGIVCLTVGVFVAIFGIKLSREEAKTPRSGESHIIVRVRAKKPEHPPVVDINESVAVVDKVPEVRLPLALFKDVTACLRVLLWIKPEPFIRDGKLGANTTVILFAQAA